MVCKVSVRYAKVMTFLFEKLKLKLSLEEIILNCRILAKHILGQKKRLEFVLRPVRTATLPESASIKETVLSKSHRQLRMNKSTLWYMRRRLEPTGTIRLYDKTALRFRYNVNQRWGSLATPPLIEGSLISSRARSE